jgi:hypothetical protein
MIQQPSTQCHGTVNHVVVIPGMKQSRAEKVFKHTVVAQYPNTQPQS